MDKDDIEKWSKRYDDEYEQRLQAIQDDLSSALYDRGYLTQDEVVDAIRWKLADWARSPHPQGATGWERVGWG
ncbi:hypothetical protein [Natronomonas marina]|uniref:hypothetical protein n=1 Tax=Natronomonas marina TaxID=2961939 RepID=UPI0020C951A7|nr:hypothetical protein [Natronomonas marina]